MNVPLEEPVPLRELPRTTLQALPVLLMPVILLWGIYGGATTPTEAAAIAAAYAFLVAVFFYRALSWSSIRAVMHDSARSSASVGLIIGSALIFNYIVASENIPAQMQQFMKGVEISPLMFLLALNLLFLVLGCFLDAATIILVIIPVFIPTVKALGIDLVHFGVVAIVNCMIGLITPPYGVLLFVLNAVTGVPLKVIIRDILPWVAVLVVALLIMIFVPDTVLWLPKQFGTCREASEPPAPSSRPERRAGMTGRVRFPRRMDTPPRAGKARAHERPRPKISFVSLGCPKALVDSERIITSLRAEGYEFAKTHAGADLVIVNTCGFLDSAKAESLDNIGRAIAENGKVIVTGCMGAEPEQIREKFPGVLAITGRKPMRAWSARCIRRCRRRMIRSSISCRRRA